MPIQLPADTNLSSPQIQLINEWNEGFSALDVELLAKPLHKDFRRVVYPRSIGDPEQNKEGWIKEITGLLGFATGFDVRYALPYSNSLPPAKSAPQTTVHSIIDAPGKVVIHVRISTLSD